MLSSYSSFLLTIAMVVESSADGNSDMDTINEAIQVFTMSTISYMSLLQMWTTMDHLLYDITPEEEAQPRQFSRHKRLRINDLSDPQAHKMTHFYHGQWSKTWDWLA